MEDCDYNIMNQLQKKCKFLHRAKLYIKDAEEDKHKKCVSVLKKIIKDEKKHVKWLKKLMHHKHKKGHYK